MVKLNLQAVQPIASAQLLMRELGGELLVYDRRHHKASCLNALAARVFKLCDGKTSPSAMAEILATEDGKTIDEYAVWLALNRLGRAKLLERPFKMPDLEHQSSRRQFLRKASTGAALALPVITTIVAPTVADAASCRAAGQTCLNDSQCCSANCVVLVCL